MRCPNCGRTIPAPLAPERYYISTGEAVTLEVPPGWDYIIIGPEIMPYTTKTLDINQQGER